MKRLFWLFWIFELSAFGKESFTATEQKRLLELDAKKGISSSSEGYSKKEREKLEGAADAKVSEDPFHGSFIEKTKAKLGAGTSPSEPGAPKPEPFLQKEKERLGTKATGGAIDAVLTGNSELHPVIRGEPHFAFGLRYGVLVNRQTSGAGSTQVRDFNDVYGSTYAPDLSLLWEYKLFRNEWLGSLGVLGTAGVSIFKGKGKLGATIQKPDGSGVFPSLTETQFQLIVLPVTLGLDYRFSAFKYLQPYVMAGGNITGLVETRNDGVKSNRGYSWGYYYSLGAAIWLNWMVPGDSFDLYLVHGVHQFYLTFEYGQLACVGGLINYTSSGFWGGMTFDY